ncbi:hypothetical protein CYMTET_54342 [Cymbomonas tetramitiformis]|uniref:Uncharacterized protein n=1 Tax=Cymbomonas tetramitiformis TaxID=36881 RepID=A0AAE0EPF5_9CHLO|nr:hypothetical protein CYMTET_54342 [Cymbomonas tetramitiformis]
MEKHARFGGNEHGATVLFAKFVPTIKEAFVNENSLFATLFDLEDITTRVRAEANKLLFSILELIYDPKSPAADWLKASAETSPHDGKRVLLETARMLLDVGTHFQGTSELPRIRFLANVDPHADIVDFNAAPASAKRKNTLHQEECYAANVKAGVPSGLSAATLAVDTEGKSVIADLISIILDLQRQVKSLSSHMDDTKNFTPRGAKTRGKMTRFAARDLPAGGNWSQTEQKKRVAFRKGSGEFIPFCANDTSLGKYTAYCQPVDASMGGFHVGGAVDGVPSFETMQREELAAQREEIHLQHAWMIDDNDDGSNELPDDGESDGKRDTETVYDARRSVVPRRGACRGDTLPPSLRKTLIPVCIAALFCLRAAAAPLAGQEHAR